MGGDFKTGNLVIEGKTKKVFEIVGDHENVLVVSKDRITAGDGAKAHDMVGKSVISTSTTSTIFKYLNAVGIKTHFVRKYDEKSFIAKKCEMIPIEWVARRFATGSFLKRNPGVKEGYRFPALKLETFYKDDANHDPQWSYEQLISAELKVGSLTLSRREIDVLLETTALVFKVLERAWAPLNCSLIDMKVEYGVTTNGELVLADVIDSDSWRLWPAGDKRLMVDKQVYRNLKEVTPEDLDRVKNNFKWVSEKVEEFFHAPSGRIIVLMGSSSDETYCKKIYEEAKKFEIPCHLRVTSAHKGTEETLHIVEEYEGEGIPTVFIAVAGRSNGLGPVMAGYTAYPVINCPPLTAEWADKDIWSSVHLPSGLGCCTVLTPENAVRSAALKLGLVDNMLWARIKANQLYTAKGLKEADKKMQLNYCS